VKSLIPVGFALLVLQSVGQLLRTVRTWQERGGHPHV
jgi:TRAP-type mannitol/chloroaromatic compound transport system permease small subunit